MRKWLILLLTLFMLLPSSVEAQGSGIVLDSLSVELYPEHDHPSMLVIYDFDIASGTTSSIDMRIPINATLYAVAYKDKATGNFLNTNYTSRSEDKNWHTYTIFVQQQTTYHLEYYQPIDHNGTQRTFTYQWTGDFAVNNFSLEIQVPSDSTDVKTNPVIPFTQSQQSISGGASLTDMKAGQNYQVKLQYSRASDAVVQTPGPSPVETLQPIDQNTEGRATFQNLFIIYIIGGIGIVLILIGLYYTWNVNKSASRSSKPRARQKRAEEETPSQIYCHECGTRAQPGDRFCRTCGSKLRIE